MRDTLARHGSRRTQNRRRSERDSRSDEQDPWTSVIMPLADEVPEPCSYIRWHGLRRSDNEAVTENSAFLTERLQLQLVCTCRSCCEAKDVRAMCNPDLGTGNPSPRRGLDRIDVR